MADEKGSASLSRQEIEAVNEHLGKALDIYAKGDANLKLNALRILNSWGRIIFVVSNDGKRIGLELTERWERERKTDRNEKMIHP